LSQVISIVSPESFCFEVRTARSNQTTDLVPVETPHHAEGPDRFRFAPPQDHATKACLECQRSSRLSGRTPEEPTHRQGRSAAAAGTVARERTPEASTDWPMAGRRPDRRPSLFPSQPDDGLIEIVSEGDPRFARPSAGRPANGFENKPPQAFRGDTTTLAICSAKKLFPALTHFGGEKRILS